MTVTLYDIARKLNITAATVSRVLNNKPDRFISDATRVRVLKTAKEMGYRPNRLARALITGKTCNIAIYVYSMQERTGLHFARMLSAIEPAARALDYDIIVCSDLEKVLKDGNVDGILMLDDPQKYEYAPCIEGIPCAYVWNAPEPKRNCIAWSDFEGAHMAGQHLLNLGHKKVAAILGDIGDISSKAAGYRKAMEPLGEGFKECIDSASGDPFEDGYLITKALLSDTPDITGILARNDVVALGAIRAIREAGLLIPQDVSVIGYNDTMLAHCADPGLTSVHTPIAEAGVYAVEHLINNAGKDNSEFEGVLLQTTITLRQSCTAVDSSSNPG